MFTERDNSSDIDHVEIDIMIDHPKDKTLGETTER